MKAEVLLTFVCEEEREVSLKVSLNPKNVRQFSKQVT